MHRSALLTNIQSFDNPALKTLGLSSLMASNELITSEFTTRFKNLLPGTELYSVVNVFEGKDLLEKYPDAIPVAAEGMSAIKDTYSGVCPTHEGVREEKLKKIENTISLGIDGLWLKNMHYPTKWDEPSPEVLDSCYCPRCLKLFTEYIGEPIEGVGGEGSEIENTILYIDGSYYHEWLEFKAMQITFFIRKVKDLITSSGGNVKLGLLTVPWKDKDYGAGTQRILAVDYTKLSDLVDVYTPMLYYQDLNNEPKWVGEMVDFFWQVGKPFFPVIKVPADAGEYLTAAEYAIKSPSMGFCSETLEEILRDQSKIEMLRGL